MPAAAVNRLRAFRQEEAIIADVLLLHASRDATINCSPLAGGS
jgi:hypothetical protein